MIGTCPPAVQCDDATPIWRLTEEDRHQLVGLGCDALPVVLQSFYQADTGLLFYVLHLAFYLLQGK